MSVFKVGKATITRIEETYQPIYTPAELFPEWTDAHLAEHEHWLVPNHYDPASGKLKLSVHSWLLQLDGRKILIDACCGNHKARPTRPWWNNLNTPWLDRLAAAGARPAEIDMVMCTHLHHDHLGWNTQLKDGHWEPTFPNARYVFSKPDFDYFQEIDRDPATAPAEFGTFRESVLPIVEAGRADLVSGPRAGSITSIR
jgi:glyoxylase-like metal-dependent hydrolase (beta-lactamase superfamily II)